MADKFDLFGRGARQHFYGQTAGGPAKACPEAVVPGRRPNPREWRGFPWKQAPQVWPQCSNGFVWVVKKCQRILRAPWKRAHEELRNEPPLDIAVRLPHYPFLASLIQTWSRGWPERDNGVVIQPCQVGARFEALDEPVFMAPSEFFGIFFTTQTKLMEHSDII